MALIKLNNRSVKDATAFGSITSLGELTFISKQTASASPTISFTSGIDSTYKEYIFYFVNCHPSNDSVKLEVNASTDGGSNYNVTKTTTVLEDYHREDGLQQGVQYRTDLDIAQGTGFQNISGNIGNENERSTSGYLHLFNPSSTTFVKHFYANGQFRHSAEYSIMHLTAGYFNTTSAVNAIRFQMTTGNIDSGDIILFGLN